MANNGRGRAKHDPACAWIRNVAETPSDSGTPYSKAVVACTCGAFKRKVKPRGGVTSSSQFEVFTNTRTHLGDGNYRARKLNGSDR